ncbi:ABC transporter permease [Paraliobacillus ryukyuensis]|uniref:ABC transporter permease n=1 Tax=Paraliobacillus ryukyuensis TaxID=200904 RepID=UPI0009A910C7|nr:FtsX-like permease family protein [Paraliobacillus ryukyuensis]
MITQLKYALEDLWAKKLYFLLFLIQITIITLLVTQCFSLIYQKEQAFNNIDDTFEASDVYYLSLAEQAKYIDSNNEEEEQIMEDLYTYATNSKGYTIFSTINDYIEIKEIPQNDLSVEVEYGPTKVQAYQTLAISPAFIDVFRLSLAKGKFFAPNWEYTSQESIPVVLGSSYQTFMEMDQKFTDSNNVTYKVAGFLQEGQNYVDISFGEGVVTLDDKILIPIDVTTFDGIYDTGNVDFQTYLENATILTTNNHGIGELSNITKKSQLYNYTFHSVAGVARYMESSTKDAVGVFLFISIWVIIFAFSLVIINTLEFVNKNLREFSIHIFCGATRKDIALRLFLQIFIVWLLASIISLLVSDRIIIVLLVSLVLLCLCLSTCIPSFIKLFHLQISDMIRRKE